MFAGGQFQKSERATVRSASPPTPDIVGKISHVGNVPATDPSTAGEQHPYSITSSAKADNDGGIVRFNDLAVRMLIRNDR